MYRLCLPILFFILICGILAYFYVTNHIHKNGW